MIFRDWQKFYDSMLRQYALLTDAEIIARVWRTPKELGQFRQLIEHFTCLEELHTYIIFYRRDEFWNNQGIFPSKLNSRGAFEKFIPKVRAYYAQKEKEKSMNNSVENTKICIDNSVWNNYIVDKEPVK